MAWGERGRRGGSTRRRAWSMRWDARRQWRRDPVHGSCAWTSLGTASRSASSALPGCRSTRAGFSRSSVAPTILPGLENLHSAARAANALWLSSRWPRIGSAFTSSSVIVGRLSAFAPSRLAALAPRLAAFPRWPITRFATVVSWEGGKAQSPRRVLVPGPFPGDSERADSPRSRLSTRLLRGRVALTS